MVKRKATRWPPAMDPPARAIAAGMLRRFGTPAVEDPGSPQPERDDDRGGGGDTADVVEGQQAHADVTEPVQAEAQECGLVEGRAALCSVATHGGRGDNQPDRGDAGGDVVVCEAVISDRSRHRQRAWQSCHQHAGVVAQGRQLFEVVRQPGSEQATRGKLDTVHDATSHHGRNARGARATIRSVA